MDGRQVRRLAHLLLSADLRPGLGWPSFRGIRSLLLAIPAFAVASAEALAENIEPRAYTNAPVGVNFLIADYSYTEGGISINSAIPLTNANLQLHTETLGYARSFGIGGTSAKFDAVVPYGQLSGTAEYAGSPVQRDISGFGDPRLRLSVNFYGAPSLSLKEFASYRQDLIVGGSLQVSLPVGQYDSSKLVNLGTNRWFVKPELGMSKAWGPWSVELLTNVTLFGKNTDFYGGHTREQDPVYTLQSHVVYGFSSGMWAAVTATYLNGGRTTIDGGRNSDLQQSSRLAATLALPVNRYNSIKLHASTGVSIRTGTDFNTVGIAWQTRWGGGL
jgi:hypothetical protein